MLMPKNRKEGREGRGRENTQVTSVVGVGGGPSKDDKVRVFCLNSVLGISS